MTEFDQLVEIMARLRQECPWDQEQSLETLRTYLIEETYECLDAMNGVIERPESPEAIAHLREELGDVLLQVLFQAKILHESSQKNEIQLILQHLKDKLIRRHPHIFSDAKAGTADEVHRRWNEIKRSEKPKASSHLGDLSKGASPLSKAHKIGEKCNKLKFDWETKDQVWKDVESEIDELKRATTRSEQESELGDILFSLVQWGRHHGMSAEAALAGANDRFLKRFQKMESYCQNEGMKFEDLSLKEKDELWQRAKRELKSS